ncbi:MAG: hypothetical protein ABSH51_01300 [Solirubrobacteraceae bacterium]|jgi:hypothetical protein
MNGTRDIHDVTTDEDERGLDLHEAAMLLEQTTRDAQRRFDFRSPRLSPVAAVVVLVALGAVWLSVRGQHPYKGPTAAGLLVMYGILICWIGFAVTVHRRAMTGLSGRSVRQQRAFGATVVVALVAVSVFQGVLKHDGASAAIVGGTYPVTAQLIVLGCLGALDAAWREDWSGFGLGLAIALIAAGSAFAGPAGVWLSDGVGCCVVLLGHGAVQAWQRRR